MVTKRRSNGSKATGAIDKHNKSVPMLPTQHSAAASDSGNGLIETKRVSAESPAFALGAPITPPSSANVREGWMEKIKVRSAARTVSANELTSLSALIAYAAFKTGYSEYRIERDLADRFNVANVKCLPSARFDEALRYLVDQVPTRAI